MKKNIGILLLTLCIVAHDSQSMINFGFTKTNIKIFFISTILGATLGASCSLAYRTYRQKYLKDSKRKLTYRLLKQTVMGGVIGAGLSLYSINCVKQSPETIVTDWIKNTGPEVARKSFQELTRKITT